MRVTVRYFAIARERVGQDQEEIELTEGATAAAAMAAVVLLHPPLASLQRLRLAVDLAFVEPSHVLHEGAQVAIIPPVSGGGSRCGIRSQPIRVEDVIERVAAPDFGGVVTFSGAIRSQSRGRRVVRLTYEAYLEMAEHQLERIAAEAKAQFGAEVAILHRVGSLEVGELAVVIAAAAPHRAAAFEACRYAIDELKREVPIWKRETYDDGEEWVGQGP